MPQGQLQHLINLKRSIEAMRGAGQSDDLIADRVSKRTDIPEQIKSIFSQAKSGGFSGKAVSDFLALPIETKTETRFGPLSQLPGAAGTLGKVSEFLGMEPLARTLAGQIGGLTQEQIGVSGRRLAGSIAQTGLTLAAPFAGKVLPGLAKGATLGQRVISGAELGAGFGAAGAAQEEKGDIVGGAITGGLIGGAIPIAGAGIKALTERFPKFLGLFTGETEAVASALRNPEAADLGIQQGDVALRNAIKRGAEKTLAIRTAAIEAQNKVTNEIGQKAGKLVYSKKDILNALKNLLKENDVKIGKTLDFTQSKIIANPGEVSKINAAWNALRGKGNKLTFNDTKKFLQLVGKLTRFADEAGIPSKSPTLGKFYNSLNKLIAEKLPSALKKTYLNSNKKFSDTIELLDDLVDAFNKGDPFKRIAQVFGKNQDTIRMLLEEYRKRTGQDIMAITAGRELAMERSAAFGFLNPREWIDLLISPQKQATLVTGAGKAIRAGERILSEKLVTEARKPLRALTGAIEARAGRLLNR